jgi:hypothetical protein
VVAHRRGRSLQRAKELKVEGKDAGCFALFPPTSDFGVTGAAKVSPLMQHCIEAGWV